MTARRARFAALTAVLLIGGAAGASDFGGSAKGTSAASFLSLGVGARALGMGDAYGAVADDASALYWNPAALAQLPSRSATVMHAPYLAGTFLDYAAYGQKLGQNGAFAGSVEYFSAGSLAQTDLSGTSEGSFSPNDLAVSLGYARSFSGYAVGAAGKYVRSHILATAQTGAVDLGALTPYYGGLVRLGATVSNVGGTMRFESEREKLPLSARLASAWRLGSRWSAGLDGVFPRDDHPYAAVGTEYLLAVASDWSLALRGGLNTRTLGEVGGFNGLALGLGLKTGRFAFDYGFLPLGTLGQSHRLGASWRWGA